jgi:hypothetical protein
MQFTLSNSACRFCNGRNDGEESKHLQRPFRKLTLSSHTSFGHFTD